MDFMVSAELITLPPKPWVVYIILCSDGSLYTGITTDLPRRFRQHQYQQGARYFRSRKPIKVVYTEYQANRSLASKREAAIKKLDRAAKLQILSTSQ